MQRKAGKTLMLMRIYTSLLTLHHVIRSGSAQDTFFPSNDQFFQNSDFKPINFNQESTSSFSSSPFSPRTTFPTTAPTRNQPESDNCALIVFVPVPSSNEMQSVCISREVVNQSFETAKRNVGLLPLHAGGEFENSNVGNLAVIIEETTRLLAQGYGLSRDTVSDGLRLIDTTQTNINNFCPNFLKTPSCRVERYRRTNGLCNNLNNPHWGAAKQANKNFLAPDFADGVSAPRMSVTGNPLPPARVVSTSLHTGPERQDHAVTMLMVIWGQFIDHDMTLSAEVEDERTNSAPDCCAGSTSQYCLPIEIPNTDRFYRKYNRRCMNFVRTVPGLRDNCKLGARSSFNEITAHIDAGTTYSNDHGEQSKLRTGRDGHLQMLSFFNGRSKDILPLRLDEPDVGCIRPFDDVYCFKAGDARANEQIYLTTLHTILAREHNRIADELRKVNPHWSDETLFQEAKMIVTAIQQQITYNEFLPMLLGRNVMTEHGLLLTEQDGYFNGYDQTVNPSIESGFTAAAFRVGHTLLPNSVERWSKSHTYIESKQLRGLFLQPYDMYKDGAADSYILGMVNQVAQAFDDAVTPEIQNHLFQRPGEHFGLDLAAINIQRGREQGVAGYNRWRVWCNLRAAQTFDDLRGWMKNSTVNHYASIYATPDDIDLWSAGISEVPLTGSMVGPTFACIIGDQFKRLRYGDRFWYENGGWPSSFTLEQLAEIRKVRLSRVICDNSDGIETMQVYAMVLHDPTINPRVSCHSGVLERIDFSKWRDVRQSDKFSSGNFINNFG